MRSRPPKITFLVDCGGAVGWGHFARAHALAAELQERGASVQLAVRGPAPTLRAAVPLQSISPAESAPFLRNSFADADLVVLDLYDWSPDELALAAAARSALLACIRDKAAPPVRFDVWIDPNVSSPPIAKPEVGPRVFAGGDYLILRSEFDALPSRAHAEVPRRLLVAFGGSDQSCLIALTLGALAIGDVAFREITVVLGGSPAPATAPSGIELRSLAHVNDMVALYQWADFGVLAAGTMLYEAAATGLPCAVVALNDDQGVEARAFGRRSAALDLGNANAVRPEAIAAALRNATARERRQSLASHARRALDGRGRVRVADALLACVREADGRTGS